MGRLAIVASCTLNLWAMDFQGNMQRILESIQVAKNAGAKLRLGSELEVPGYSCADHFLENDTFQHSLEVLGEILKNPIAQDILIFLGMPILHKNVSYNCLVAIYNKKILLLRPKMFLCDDRNYSESRHFSAWKKVRQTEPYILPKMLQEITGQKTVPIGDGVVCTLDTCIGVEICEELWTADSPNARLALDGVEIILNASGNHHELRVSVRRSLALVQTMSEKNGGVYIYSNQRGCDGDRLYFDGEALICINGSIVAQAKQFDLADVEVITAAVDLEDVRASRIQYRSARQRSASEEAFPRVYVDMSLTNDEDVNVPVSPAIQPYFNAAVQEIAMGPACFLWDVLRRSGKSGYFLALDGSDESSAVACIALTMCRMVCSAIESGNKTVLSEIKKITGDDFYKPTEPKELCNRLLTTCYVGFENSNEYCRTCVKEFAQEIGSYHLTMSLDKITSQFGSLFETATGRKPTLAQQGGSEIEDRAIKHLQERLQMSASYFFAQLTQWSRNKRNGLLVLSSSNVDDGLTGDYVKYGASAADINPIGGVSKTDITNVLKYFETQFGITSLNKILQNDRKDDELQKKIGLSFEEICLIGKLRKPGMCGPFSTFCKLVHLWKDKLTPREVAYKVKIFFRLYSINRHKATVLTPTYHAEMYSAEDHRHDHRQFLYNVEWTWQFNQIDEKVKKLEKLVKK